MSRVDTVRAHRIEADEAVAAVRPETRASVDRTVADREGVIAGGYVIQQNRRGFGLHFGGQHVHIHAGNDVDGGRHSADQHGHGHGGGHNHVGHSTHGPTLHGATDTQMRPRRVADAPNIINDNHPGGTGYDGEVIVTDPAEFLRRVKAAALADELFPPRPANGNAAPAAEPAPAPAADTDAAAVADAPAAAEATPDALAAAIEAAVARAIEPLNARIGDLEHRLGAAHTMLEAAAAEITRLREENAQLKNGTVAPVATPAPAADAVAAAPAADSVTAPAVSARAAHHASEGAEHGARLNTLVASIRRKRGELNELNARIARNQARATTSGNASHTLYESQHRVTVARLESELATETAELVALKPDARDILQQITDKEDEIRAAQADAVRVTIETEIAALYEQLAVRNQRAADAAISTDVAAGPADIDVHPDEDALLAEWAAMLAEPLVDDGHALVNAVADGDDAPHAPLSLSDIDALLGTDDASASAVVTPSEQTAAAEPPAPGLAAAPTDPDDLLAQINTLLAAEGTGTLAPAAAEPPEPARIDGKDVTPSAAHEPIPGLEVYEQRHLDALCAFIDPDNHLDFSSRLRRPGLHASDALRDIFASLDEISRLDDARLTQTVQRLRDSDISIEQGDQGLQYFTALSEQLGFFGALSDGTPALAKLVAALPESDMKTELIRDLTKWQAALPRLTALYWEGFLRAYNQVLSEKKRQAAH